MDKKQLIVAWAFVFLLPSLIFASEKIKIIWLDNEGNYIVNEEYIKSAPEAIRAVLAYYSLKGGVSCWWDGDKPNKEWNNINCGLTKALGLGYQCSQKQLDFVNSQFKEQGNKFTYKDCNSALETATISNRLPFLELEIIGDVISARYCHSFSNTRRNEYLTYWGKDTFRAYPNKIVILNRMIFKEHAEGKIRK